MPACFLMKIEGTMSEHENDVENRLVVLDISTIRVVHGRVSARKAFFHEHGMHQKIIPGISGLRELCGSLMRGLN